MKVHIDLPYYELKKIRAKNPKYGHNYDLGQWVELRLPYIPRIGEYIDFSFSKQIVGWSSDEKYTKGYVVNVKHEINGYSHDILLEVHPFKGEYHRWKRLEEEYLEDQRWERRLKSQDFYSNE